MYARAHNADHPPRIAIWVESFWTEGHISLVERLSRSLMARGVDVMLLGDKGTLERRKLDGIHTFQLPNRDQEDYGETFKQAVRDYAPDILITELIPFGYPDIMENLRLPLHELKQEFALKRQPFELMSWTRDLPDATPDPKYRLERWGLEGFTDIMDAIVIQGDKRFLAHPYIEDKLNPFGWRVRGKTHYMGYPVPHLEPKESSGEVVVVAGGGFGAGQKQHFVNVLQAMPHLHAELREKTWRLFVSKNASPEDRAELEAMAAEFPNVIIDTSGPHFKEAQVRADMLVTQGGMTSVECVSLGRPTTIVPHFRESGWAAMNQVTRGEALAKASACTTCVGHLDAQNPEQFAKALDKCYATKDRTDVKLPQLDGHERFAEWLVARCKEMHNKGGAAVSR